MKISIGEGLQEKFSRRHGSSEADFSTLEDFSDRLNSFYTTVVMLILASITMTNVYFLRPIACTVPSSPSGAFGAYTESVCWVQGTIGLNKGQRIPNSEAEWELLREKSDISFYQWVPFCLSVQAILFYLPHLIWQSLSVNTLGDNLNYLVTRAKTATTSDDSATRSRLVQACADHLYLLSRQHADNRGSCLARLQHNILALTPCASFCLFGKRLGNRTTVLYLFIKLLYIANCVGQIFLVMTFLGPDDTSRRSLWVFSERLFNVASKRREWGGSELFPHQALCPVRVPNLGIRSQTYTALCALPVNMLNEKIYLFLWVWILAVLAVSVAATFVWMRRLLIQTHGEAFLRSFLEISLLVPHHTAEEEASDRIGASHDSILYEKQMGRFLKNVVGCDGNFLIRMLRLNSGDVITGEILVAWWRLFKSVDDEESTKGSGV